MSHLRELMQAAWPVMQMLGMHSMAAAAAVWQTAAIRVSCMPRYGMWCADAGRARQGGGQVRGGRQRRACADTSS